jgi:hypothetical protein
VKTDEACISKVFARLLEQAVSTPAATYRDIIGNNCKEKQI